MDHLLHRAQSLLPHVLAVGPPQGDDPSLAIALEVRPFLHDLPHLQADRSTVYPAMELVTGKYRDEPSTIEGDRYFSNAF